MLKIFNFFDNYLHYNFFVPMICGAMNIILLFCKDFVLLIIGGLSFIIDGFGPSCDFSWFDDSVNIYIYFGIYVIRSGLALALAMIARCIYSAEKIKIYRKIMILAYICLSISYALIALFMIGWTIASFAMIFLFIIPFLIQIFIVKHGIKITLSEDMLKFN